MPRAAFLAIRFAYLAFFFVTHLYCLLAYAPLTYTQVLTAGLLPWLSWFGRAHAWLTTGTLACGIATLWPDFVAPRTRMFAVAYAIVSAMAGIALAIHPILPSLENDTRSFVWSQIALIPPATLALFDHLAVHKKLRWGWTSTREDTSVLAASLTALGLVFAVYSIVFHLRVAPHVGLTLQGEGVALLWSLLLHASFAGALFVTWCLVRALATWARGPAAWTEYLLLLGVAAVFFGFLLRNVVFGAMAFRGPLATASAFGSAFVFVVAVSGVALRGEAGTARPIESPLRLLLSTISCPRASMRVRLLWLLAIVALAVRLQIVASRMDWNGLLQQLGACFGSIAFFASSLALWPPAARGEGRTIRLMLLASIGTLAYGAWRNVGHPADTAPGRETLAAGEPSFGFLYALAATEGTQKAGELFEFMQQNSNMQQERRIEPLDVSFSSDLGSAPGKRPNVFIIVVDSLRRDYVSPFNPSVTFTPSLAQFAASSDVFTNAFTHYGATGLSEPSIWVGGMMPHKQYITPFSPMNALEKLLLAEHYVRMISVDSILAQLLDRGPSLVAMDEHTVTGDYDLCTTLDELRTKIGARRGEGAPIFAYTQPQNIHVSRITREGASVPPGAQFPGFYAPYAYRLQRLDACFGRFIDYLKAEGLYDESIVVFTADHGDLLGEEGRWGHAYMLNPEVVRIPLIIHRPRDLRDGISVDTSSVAFSTDITPSIYRLFGYMPATLGTGFGQSLYGPRAPDREWHMLVSSYGPVYGILEDEGRHLYVADAVSYTDTYFDVTASSNAPRQPVSEEERNRNMARIVSGVKELHAAFGIGALGTR